MPQICAPLYLTLKTDLLLSFETLKPTYKTTTCSHYLADHNVEKTSRHMYEVLLKSSRNSCTVALPLNVISIRLHPLQTSPFWH